MRSTTALLLCVLLGACANPAPPTTAASPANSTAPLLNTHWSLTQLGDRAVTTPQGARDIHIVLHSDNPRVAGFSGCNQMMGAYVLDGNQLRFEQVGGTLMACTSDLQLEREFLAIFDRVASLEIQGETLQLLDADRNALARFAARP
jgi:heat shock protein HslJ